MLPAFSVWCDPSAISDPDLLEALGRSNANTAIGVLCNPHLSGDRLVRVAQNANFLVKLLEPAHLGRSLMLDRTTADQVAIIEAAAVRSTAAARMLTEHLNPEAALQIYRAMVNHRLGSHREIADAIRVHAERRCYQAQLTHPAYAELMTELGGEQADAWILIAEAHKARTADQLRDLAPRLAARGQMHHPLSHHLPVALYCFPEVLGHWATHGGLTGALIAAGDHRCSPEILLDLFDRWEGHEGGSAVLEALLLNPAVPMSRKREWLARDFTERLDDSLVRGEFWSGHGRDRNINTLVEVTKAVADLDPADLAGTLTTPALDRILSSRRLWLPKVFWLDLLHAAKAIGSPMDRVYATLDMLLDMLPFALPVSVIDAIVAIVDGEISEAGVGPRFHADDLTDLTSTVQSRLCTSRTAAVKVARYTEEDPRATWYAFETGYRFDGPAGSARHTCADSVAALTTLEQYQELFAIAELGDAQAKAAGKREPIIGDPVDVNEPFRDRIARVAAAAAVVTPHAGRGALDGLIQGALGAL